MFISRRSVRPLASLQRAASTSTLQQQPPLPRIDAAGLLSDDDVERFSEEGAIVLRQACVPEWVGALRAAAELNLDSPGPLCDEHAAARRQRAVDERLLDQRRVEELLQERVHVARVAAVGQSDRAAWWDRPPPAAKHPPKFGVAQSEAARQQQPAQVHELRLVRHHKRRQ